MKVLKLITHCILLVTTPTLLAYPSQEIPTISFQKINDGYQKNTEKWTRPNTYDEIIQMLEDLESGVLEKKYSPMELEKINDYIITLAKEGVLPNEPAEEEAIEEDTYDLMYGKDSALELIKYLENSHSYRIIPAVIYGEATYNIMQCGKISKAWKKTKKYAKKHKKALIIGAVVVVAVAAITVAVVVASSASVASTASTAAGAVGAAASDSESHSSSKSQSNENTSSDQSIPQLPTSPPDIPIFKSAIEEEVSSFKENLAKENFFQPIATGEGLSLEETGRAVGSLFAHESFHHFNNQMHPPFSQEMQNIASENHFPIPAGASSHPISFGHNEIDNRFASNCGSLFSSPDQDINFTALSYQVRGEAAHSYGYYDQAVQDFTKAIHINQADPTPYLQRSASYFDMGQYSKSIEDFNTFRAQVEKTPENIPFSQTDFTLGFAKGLPKGIYESGKGIILFLGDFISHPIHTSTQMYEALSTLAKLALNDEWGVIGEILSPEIHQLVTEWDSLPSDKKGELAGYAFGKHGADIAAPGAVAKIASKSAKSAKELAAVLKNLQQTEGTLVLETASGIGDITKLSKIISSGEKTAFLGEELGFTAKEMGQLKEAGKLETTLQETFNHLSVPKKESLELFREAERYLRGYKGFRPEKEIRDLIHGTGLPTFPRPKGVPENYRVKLSNTGAGMKYVHPKDEGTYIRVMPGKPHSPNPQQQQPYVNHRIHGESVNKFGEKVPNDSIESHIPLEEFVYRNF